MSLRVWLELECPLCAVAPVGEWGVRIDQQRLDSTHTFGAMASFGGTRLMRVTVKRLLTQV